MRSTRSRTTARTWSGFFSQADRSVAELRRHPFVCEEGPNADKDCPDPGNQWKDGTAGGQTRRSHPSMMLYLRHLFPLAAREYRIDLCMEQMVGVVAQGLHGDGQDDFQYMPFAVTGCQEVFHITPTR